MSDLSPWQQPGLTPEERAETLRRWAFGPFRIREAIEAAVADAAPTWIAVTERYPETVGDYLIVCQSSYADNKVWLKTARWSNVSDSPVAWYHLGAAYWMPAPAFLHLPDICEDVHRLHQPKENSV